jgi:hypothetical protein
MSGASPGTTESAHRDNNVVPLVNKTPVYVSGVRNTSKVLEYIRANSSRKVMPQTKSDYIKLVPDTGDAFRATIGALWSLSKGELVSFHTFSLRDDRCVRCWEAYAIACAKATSERSSRSCYPPASPHAAPIASTGQDVQNDRPLTPYCIVSVARESVVGKLSTIVEFCGLRARVRTCNLSKRPYNANTARTMDTRSITEHKWGKCVTTKQ